MEQLKENMSRKHQDKFNVSNSELSKMIDENIRGLKAVRNRKILKDRLINGLLYREIADKYNLSIDRAQKIVYRLQEQIFKR